MARPARSRGSFRRKPHDHRHTVSTHLEAMGFDELTVSAIVGHKRKGMTGRCSHYRREKEMRVALTAWERRVLDPHDC